MLSVTLPGSSRRHHAADKVHCRLTRFSENGHRPAPDLGNGRHCQVAGNSKCRQIRSGTTAHLCVPSRRCRLSSTAHLCICSCALQKVLLVHFLGCLHCVDLRGEQDTLDLEGVFSIQPFPVDAAVGALCCLVAHLQRYREELKQTFILPSVGLAERQGKRLARQGLA